MNSSLVRTVVGAALAVTALAACVSIDSMRARSSQPSPPPNDTFASVPVESEWARSKRLFEEQFAAEYAEFRKREPRLRDGSTKAVADEADALRTRFVKRCISESKLSSIACWNATFARDITEELARIRKQTGDTVRAYLELYTLGYQPDLRSEQAQEKYRMGHSVWTEATDAVRAVLDVRERITERVIGGVLASEVGREIDSTSLTGSQAASPDR